MKTPRLKPRPSATKLYLKDQREGKFRLVWYEGSRKRYSPEYIPTLEQAIRQKALKELTSLISPPGIQVADPTAKHTRLAVADAVDLFLSELVGRGNTVSLYTQNLRQFQRWTTETYVDQIDRSHLTAFKKFLVAEIGNDEYTAVWKCIRVNKMIKVVLQLGPGAGPVKKSDFADVLNRKPMVTTYRKEERDKFFAACNGIELVIWRLAFMCGLRLKELSHLEWSDIDFERHLLRIRAITVNDSERTTTFVPKKWSARDIAVPTELIQALLGYKSTSRSNLCFPTRTGRINTKLWDQCKKIARNAKVDVAKFMPKNFRASYATNRLQNGYAIADIRDQMGHRDIHSVEHYLDAMRSEELMESGRADAGWD